MKSRDAVQRLKRFEAEAQIRKVADLEQMVREFELMAHELDRQVQAEEERTGIRDRGHFAYSTFAKSVSQRRDNLRSSVEDLKERLASAIAERDEVLAALEPNGGQAATAAADRLAVRA